MGIQWSKIKKNYPKAFKKLLWFYENIPIEINEENRLGWYFTDGVHHVGMWTDMGNDMLYSFFDEQGIFIEIKYDPFDLTNNMWSFTIYQAGLFDGGTYSTRNKTEKAAFQKAFRTLEKLFLK